MNKLRSVLKKKRAKEDPRVRRRLFSWRMFAIILLVVSVLSAGNVFALEKLLKMQVFSVVASMGVGSYWVAMAFLAAIVLHLYTCRRFDRPMRALSRAMRQVTEGDFTVRVKPFHNANKFDYMDIMCEDFNRMVQELGSTETMKNDFIANVSHEIRTPLTVMNSYASALARGGLSEAEQREYAATIAAASESLSTMVSNILRLNKLENQEITPNAAPYDLTRQLCDCALTHEARWEAKNIDFDAQLEERVMVLADETMMEIVFNNLISNAIKFTEAGGRIHTSTVTVAVMPEAEEVELDIRPEDLRFDVFRSSGPGGQCVNTTDSAVRVTHIPTGLSVASQQEKSQHRNKEIALRILYARMLEHKQQEEASKQAADKRSQVGTGDRSERIRTYNFPQNRVTDHRYNVSTFDLPKLMEGELNLILDQILMIVCEQRLEQLRHA